MKFDPAAIMIGVGGVVLLLAVWWLLETPRGDPIEQAACEGRPGRVFIRTTTASFCVVGEKF